MRTSILAKGGLAAAIVFGVLGTFQTDTRGAMAARNREPWVGVAVPSSEVMLAPPQRGILAELFVKPGDAVKSGQILGKLNSKLQQIREQRWADEVRSSADVKLATASLEFAASEEERGRKLGAEDVIKPIDLVRLVHDTRVARIRLEQAMHERQKAVASWEEAKVVLAMRNLTSPIDGVVVMIAKDVGEAVEELEPVIQVVALDPLWVEFDCPVVDGIRFPMGREVGVSLTSDSEAIRVGKVIWVSSMADPASHTFKVRLQVPNRVDPWKGGLRVFISEYR